MCEILLTIDSVCTLKGGGDHFDFSAGAPPRSPPPSGTDRSGLVPASVSDDSALLNKSNS